MNKTVCQKVKWAILLCKGAVRHALKFSNFYGNNMVVLVCKKIFENIKIINMLRCRQFWKNAGNIYKALKTSQCECHKLWINKLEKGKDGCSIVTDFKLQYCWKRFF